MPTINTTSFANLTSPANFLSQANINTHGWFWTGALYSLIIIIFLSLIQYGEGVAIMVALFIGILAGVFLLTSNLISFTSFGIILGIELFLIIYYMWSSNKNQ